jgi:uncharacterized protein
MQNLNIHHDLIKHVFFTRVREGMARLNYDTQNRSVMVLKDTYVPASDRGKGVGSALVDYALTYARERAMRIQPECPFVRQYLEEQTVSKDN